jgi:hypothetical protein
VSVRREEHNNSNDNNKETTTNYMGDYGQRRGVAWQGLWEREWGQQRCLSAPVIAGSRYGVSKDSTTTTSNGPSSCPSRQQWLQQWGHQAASYSATAFGPEPEAALGVAAA